MALKNAEIVSIFDEIADLLELEAANPFRIRAYRNAARVIGESRRDVSEMVAQEEELTALPGIGPDLAEKIREIVDTGHCDLLDRLHRQLPAAITELLPIPGLGPKKVRALWHDLDVQTPQELYRAARDGRSRAASGLPPPRRTPRRSSPICAASKASSRWNSPAATVAGVKRSVTSTSSRWPLPATP